MIEVHDERAMKDLGEQLGSMLRGGEVIELIGDVGAGKTTLVKSLARGMGIDETVQSPSFTISREYQSPADIYLVHYDFYRLGEAGIMGSDVRENMSAPDVVTVIEWAGVVSEVLPSDRLTVRIAAVADDDARQVSVTGGGERSRQLATELAA